MKHNRLTLTVLGVATALTLSACGTMQNTGTPFRPVLTDQEAAKFTMDNYFAVSGLLAAPKADPWKPTSIDTSANKPDFVVGTGGTHDSIQKAVNAAMAKGGKDRIYIKVMPGTYTGAVYVPINGPQITIFGAGAKPDDVKVQLTLDAMVLPEVYAKTVNPSGQFVEGDPAWNMYNICATLPAKNKIDTPCSSVVWAQSQGFQLKNMTIANTLLDTVDNGTHQAVALRTDGDKTQLENLRLLGRQDTLLVNAGEAPTQANKIGTYPVDRIARAYIKDTYVEGDIDFVFGRANAVFDNCEFRVISNRKKDRAVVFAPDTVPNNSFGFLVINSRMTGDAGYLGTGNAKLGRSWDQGASATGYLVGKTPNGQIVIRDTSIDSSFSLDKPWDDGAATTNRPHLSNVSPDRNLDDPKFNRLWEYNNKILR